MVSVWNKARNPAFRSGLRGYHRVRRIAGRGIRLDHVGDQFAKFFEVVHHDNANAPWWPCREVVVEAWIYRFCVAARRQVDGAGERDVQILRIAISGVLKVGDDEIELLVVSGIFVAVFDVIEGGTALLKRYLVSDVSAGPVRPKL